MASKTYTINANYVEDDEYYASEKDTDFNVLKSQEKITADIGNVKSYQNATVNINNLVNATGNVTVTVKCTTYTLNLTEGRSLNLDVLPAGTYTVEIDYEGDNNYSASTNTCTFTVTNLNGNDLQKLFDDFFGNLKSNTNTLQSSGPTINHDDGVSVSNDNDRTDGSVVNLRGSNVYGTVVSVDSENANDDNGVPTNIVETPESNYYKGDLLSAFDMVNTDSIFTVDVTDGYYDSDVVIDAAVTSTNILGNVNVLTEDSQDVNLLTEKGSEPFKSIDLQKIFDESFTNQNTESNSNLQADNNAPTVIKVDDGEPEDDGNYHFIVPAEVDLGSVVTFNVTNYTDKPVIIDFQGNYVMVTDLMEKYIFMEIMLH